MSEVHIEDGVEYGDSYLISAKIISVMEGQMLTLVELLGLPEEQSEAMKSELRQRIWGGTFLKHGHYVWCKNVPKVLKKIKEVQKVG